MGNETSIPQSEPHTTKPTPVAVNSKSGNSASKHLQRNQNNENGSDFGASSASRVSGESNSPLESPRKFLPPSQIESNRRASNKTNVTILRGVVVGKDQTGKTSLIRRLRGEDPFGSPNHQVHRRETDSGQKSKRNLMALVPWKFPHNLQPNLSIIQEDVVQLYVSEGRSFQSSFLTTSSNSSDEKSHESREYSDQIHALFRKEWLTSLRQQNGKELDFVVWVVDPRMDNLLEFLTVGLGILFPPATSVEESKGQNDEESDVTPKSGINDHTAPLVRNLCILLNFRDILSPKSTDGTTLENVRQLTNIIIQKHAPLVDEIKEKAPARLITEKHPNIVVYESSMLNCYGLQQLHSFIALPYLSFKEREYLNRAETMRNGHRKWKDALMQFDVVGYDEFARGLDAETTSNSNMKDQQRRPQRGEPLQSRPHGSVTETVSVTEKEEDQQLERDASAEQKTATKAILSGQRGKTKANSSERSKFEDSSAAESNNFDASSSSMEAVTEPGIEELSGPPNVGPRKLFSSLHKPPATSNAWAPMDSADDALDSFFADDEDLIDRQENKKKGIHSSNSPKGKVENFLNSDDSSDGNSSDDSEDDDFYIDNSGIRHAHSQLNAKLSRPETSASAMAGTISPNSKDDEQSTSYTKASEKECEKDSDDKQAKSLVEMKLRKSSPTKSHDDLESQKDSLDAHNEHRPETPATSDVNERDNVSQQSVHDSQNQILNGDSHDEVHCVSADAKFMKEDCTEKNHLPLSSCDVGDASDVVSEDGGVHSSEAGNNDSIDSTDSVTNSPQKNTPPAKNEKLELTDSTDKSTTKHDNDDTLATHESYDSSDLNVVITKEKGVDSATNEESTPTLFHVNGSNRDQSLKAENSFEVNGVTERLQSSIESKSMEGDIDKESVPDQSQSVEDGEVVAPNDSSSNMQNTRSSVHVEGAAPSNNINAVDNNNGEVVPCNKSMVLDSDDDESVGSQKDSFREIKSKPQKTQGNDSDEDDEFIIDESVSSKPMRPESTPSNQNGDSSKRNEQNILQKQLAQPPTVSNAALAAIEAAKREAERMMVTPQTPLATSKVGKDRKDKKKSEKKKAKNSSIGLDGEKKKKKKDKEKEKKKKEKKDGY